MAKRKSNQIRTLLLICLGFLFHTNVSLAQPVPSFMDEEDDADRTWEQMLIEDNIRFSKWFDTVAEGLDLFLVGKKVTEKRNESSVRIENSTFSVEGQSVTNSTALSVIPRFPNFEEYWNLKFTTYDEQQDRRNAQTTYLRQAPREQNVGASVGFFRKLGNVRTAFQPRIELQNPLKISHSLSFESIADYKIWQINPKLEFYANPVKGPGVFTALNFNIYFTPRDTLTFINQGDYINKQNRLELTNGIQYGHAISSRTGVGVGFFAFTNNRPGTHLESYSLSTSYTHIIYRKILDYAIIPHLDFYREKNFKGLAGLTFTFNINF